MNDRARLRGAPRSIPDEDRDHFLPAPRADGGVSDDGRMQRAAAPWRYYLRLTASV